MIELDGRPRPGVVAVADLKSIPTHWHQDQYRFTQDVRKLNKHRQFVKYSDIESPGVRHTVCESSPPESEGTCAHILWLYWIIKLLGAKLFPLFC